ncbi:hypothetical protein [Bifidobacterium longum]|uniref:hypothetical protein n=1 Tax=Bifidobacterium longum TaxID=216816 RepID=UPI001E2A44A3|nr:hypothetical protein [Bifidobacterium longum]
MSEQMICAVTVSMLVMLNSKWFQRGAAYASNQQNRKEVRAKAKACSAKTRQNSMEHD